MKNNRRRPPEVVTSGPAAPIVGVLVIALIALVFYFGWAIAHAEGRSCADPQQSWPGKAADCWGVQR